jgi:hypothetical protein
VSVGSIPTSGTKSLVIPQITGFCVVLKNGTGLSNVIVPVMSIDSVKAKLDRAHEHILSIDAALAGADPLARHVMVLVGTGTSITVDNLNPWNVAPGESREVVLAVSTEYRLHPESRPETADDERWTLNATFAQFGQNSDQPLVPGLVERETAVTQIISECRSA